MSNVNHNSKIVFHLNLCDLPPMPLLLTFCLICRTPKHVLLNWNDLHNTTDTMHETHILELLLATQFEIRIWYITDQRLQNFTHTICSRYTMFHPYVRKVFNTVWVNGLLYKLYKLGLTTKTWRLIRECFRDIRCSAFIAGEVAEWFIPERGVHQGAPLSMTLYQIYVNDLLQELRTSQYGAYLMDRDSTCPAFADDCIAIAMRKLGLNKLMTIAHAHSVK